MAYYVQDKCLACSACYRVCEASAIFYGKGNKYHVDPQKCTSCGSCQYACSINAILPDEESKKLINEQGGKIVNVEIIKEKCVGCSLCAKNCPVGAIEGEIRSPYIIEDWICVCCGKCVQICKKNAIRMKRKKFEI